MAHVEQRLLEKEHILQFDVVISKEELLSKVEESVAKAAKKGSLKGFRPGHTPKKLLLNLYGDSFLAEAFHKIVDSTVNNFWDELTLPKIDLPVLAPGEDPLPSLQVKKLQDEYRLTFEVGLFPSEVKGLSQEDEYEKISVEIPEELVAKEMDELRRSTAIERETSEPVAPDDLVEIKIVELDGDHPKEGGWQQETHLRLTDEIPAAVQQSFIGKSAGDTVRIHVEPLRSALGPDALKRFLRIPDEDNREVSDWFEAQILKVIRFDLPEMNEEFFQKYFGRQVQTQEQAENIIRESIKSNYAQFIADDFVGRLLQHLEALNLFDMPERYLKQVFRTRTDGKEAEAHPRVYEAYVSAAKKSYLMERLQALTQTVPSDEEIANEVYASVYRSLRRFGLEEHTQRFVEDMVNNRPEQVRKIIQQLVYRLLAERLPAYVKVKEIPMTPAALDEKMAALSAEAQSAPAEEASPPDAASEDNI